ncbi:hypothetical protein M0805_008471 [Coniferiporia weirii]|nr:hypothetical protein M0805_008471 [Coniferiporia weirii]
MLLQPPPSFLERATLSDPNRDSSSSSSSGIVLPAGPLLKTWTEQRLTVLFTAKTQADFDRAFDDFVTENIEVTFNGAYLTREEYKRRLQGRRLFEHAATIEFPNIVMVQAAEPHEKPTENSGMVGIFYEARYVKKALPLGPPAKHAVQSSLNMKVAQDEHLDPQRHKKGICNDSPGVNRWRVVSLNQVSVDQRVYR